MVRLLASVWMLLALILRQDGGEGGEDPNGGEGADGGSGGSGNGTNGGDPGELGDAGKRALDAERKARREAEAKLKEYEPLVAKAREFEESQKTELQKLTEQLDEARADAATAQQHALRLEVGTAKGLPPELISRLEGSTKEQLEADADVLAKLVPPRDTDPNLGPHGSGPSQLTRDALKTMTPEQIEKARTDGRLDTLLKGG